MSNSAIPRDFVKNVMHNGIGRYVCQLKRITFRFCKSNPSSRFMRAFVEDHLLEFSQTNQGVVCYLQPRRHRLPSIVAEFLNGRREVMEVKAMEVSEICKWVEHMRTRSGVEIVNLIQPTHTETPSIQGIWHPFIFKDSELAACDFPDQRHSEVLKIGNTATDDILGDQELQTAVSQLKVDEK